MRGAGNHGETLFFNKVRTARLDVLEQHELAYGNATGSGSVKRLEKEP
jgi:hypothetical protein